MDSQDKLDEALRDWSPADEDMLDAFLLLHNEHLERAIQSVTDINQLLKGIRQELET